MSRKKNIIKNTLKSPESLDEETLNELLRKLDDLFETGNIFNPYQRDSLIYWTGEISDDTETE